MKNIISLYIIIGLIGYQHLNTQCGTTINCGDHPYPYYACSAANGWKMVAVCTNNPLGLNPLLYKLRSPEMPPCLNWITGGPTQADMATDPGFPENYITVYTETEAENDVNKALYDWLCLCNMQGGSCKCTLNVNVTDDPDDFFKIGLGNDDVKYTAALCGVAYYPDNTCGINCNQSILLFNCTDDFTGLATGTYKKYFVNEYYLNNYQGGSGNIITDIADYVDLLSFYDIASHELGHFFGFGHSDGDPDYGEPPCLPPYESIMKRTARKLTSGDNKSRGLTHDDKCMFMKKYCPAYVPVEDDYDNKYPESILFPNPFEEKTQISFTVLNNNSYVSLTIYDNYGRKVNVLIDQYYEKGDHLITFDAKQLSSGCYFYVLKIQGIVQSKQMLFVK